MVIWTPEAINFYVIRAFCGTTFSMDIRAIWDISLWWCKLVEGKYSCGMRAIWRTAFLWMQAIWRTIYLYNVRLVYEENLSLWDVISKQRNVASCDTTCGWNCGRIWAIDGGMTWHLGYWLILLWIGFHFLKKDFIRKGLMGFPLVGFSLATSLISGVFCIFCTMVFIYLVLKWLNW